MLEAEPHQRVGKLDVDAEIVGVQLELIALEQPGILVDIHRERRGLALDRQLPVAVARRFRLEIDERFSVCELPRCASHGRFPCMILHVWVALIVHYFALSSSNLQEYAE